MSTNIYPVRYCQCIDNCGKKLSKNNTTGYMVGHRIPATCVICGNSFSYKNRGGDSPTILTCSKPCKNEFARRQVTKYFEDPDNREKARQATLKSIEGVDCKAKLRKNGYVPVSGEDHHRTGVKLPQSQIEQQREKVSGDKHHLHGKTYEEYYGEEKAAEIKEARAECMAETNARLIEIGSSKIERRVFEEHFEDHGFIHGRRIGKHTADYCHEDKKIVVEFNGDVWHANPELERFADENMKHPTLNMTVKEKREADAERIQYIEDYGFKVIVLWENDYLQDPVKAIEQVFSNF